MNWLSLSRFTKTSREKLNRELEEFSARGWQKIKPNGGCLFFRSIQPGLAGLMDGSVSTLAPRFAAAFATRDSWDAFLVGVAASIGAGISMGFAEALSDERRPGGRGRPAIRGVVAG